MSYHILMFQNVCLSSLHRCVLTFLEFEKMCLISIALFIMMICDSIKHISVEEPKLSPSLDDEEDMWLGNKEYISGAKITNEEEINRCTLSLCNYRLSRGVYYSIQYNGPRPDCTCAYHTVSTVSIPQ